MTYSSTLALSRDRFNRRNQNNTSFKIRERTLGPISNTIILIILMCLLGLLYLTQVTKSQSYSYKINTLSLRRTELQNENDDLVVASARLQSLDRIKNSSVAKKMVSVAPSDTIAD